MHFSWERKVIAIYPISLYGSIILTEVEDDFEVKWYCWVNRSLFSFIPRTFSLIRNDNAELFVIDIILDKPGLMFQCWRPVGSVTVAVCAVNLNIANIAGQFRDLIAKPTHNQ